MLQETNKRRKVDNGEIFLKRSDPLMNDYMSLITLLMKSNMDIKIIPGMDTMDLLLLLYYLTNYTNKAEMDAYYCRYFIYC